MSQYAQLGTEYFEREEELTDKEAHLYRLIMLHSFSDSGLSNKTIAEIIAIWGLHYTNTMGRYKVLRGEFREEVQARKRHKEEPWLEEAAQIAKEKLRKRLENMKSPWVIEERHGYIRPLVGIVWTRQQETIKSIREKLIKNKTLEFRVEPEKTLDSKVETLNSKVLFDTKTLDSKVETLNSKVPLYKDYSEPYQRQENPTATPEMKNGGSVGANGHKSKFSYEECVRYAEICKTRGEEIRSVGGLADYLYKSGEKDFLIEATLYPELLDVPEIEQPIIYDYDGDGNLIPKHLSTRQLAEALAQLVEAQSEDFDVNDYRQYYTLDDWAWLMKELAKCEKS